jgi:hypothetical protein
MRRLQRLMVSGVGLVALAIGAWRALYTDNGATLVALVAAGGLLLFSPFVVDRLEGVSVGSGSLELRLSRQIAEQGAPKTAQILDQTQLAGLAEAYAVIHEELPDPDYTTARTHLQDILVHRAAAVARQQKLDAEEVRRLFEHAAPITRVLVLGLMEGDPSLADAPSLGSAIARPATRNEQYHALLLAKRYWNRFTNSERTVIHASIDDADLPKSSRRYPMAAEIRALPLSG